MEKYQLTPGAERALEFSVAWVVCDESSEIQPVELVCGLLAEPECRAALLLTAHGIDEAAVQCHWPALRRRSTVAKPGSQGRFCPAQASPTRMGEAGSIFAQAAAKAGLAPR